MSLNIQVKWSKPISLKMLPAGGDRIIDLAQKNDWNKIPTEPGVYFFGRISKNKDYPLYPLYIGRADDIKLRIKQHFDGSVALMNKLGNKKKYGRGVRVLVVGNIPIQKGQRSDDVLRITESALIEQAIHDEWNLFNKKGTKTRFDNIELAGYRGATNIFGRTIKVAENRRK